MRGKYGEGFNLYKYDDDTQTVTEEEWSEEQVDDINSPHIHRTADVRSVVLNDRFYLFQNVSETNLSCVKVVCPILKRMFTIKLAGTDNKPSCSRVNYSIASFQNRVFLYGGLDENTKVLGSMDVFDAITCKFQPVKYRGDYTPKSRQGHAAICLDRYTMVVMGGTFQDSIVDPQPVPPDEAILIHDTEGSQWQLKSKTNNSSSDPMPWNLVYHSLFKLDSQNIGVLWYDNIRDELSGHTLRILRVSQYNYYRNSWRSIRICQQERIDSNFELEFKFGTSLIMF